MRSKRAMYAYEAGYRIIDGEVYSLKSGKIRKLSKSGKKDSYPKFSFKYMGTHMTCKAHQLTAWQKFGTKCIGADVVVRHLDDDKWNFKHANIEIGTREDNERDRVINRKKKMEKVK